MARRKPAPELPPELTEALASWLRTQELRTHEGAASEEGKAKPFKRDRRLPKVLRRREWDPVVEAAGEDRRQPLLALRDQAICALFLQSGIRVGELVALDLSDVAEWSADEGWTLTGVANVRHGKGDKQRFAAVGPEALDLLDAYLDVRPGAEEAGRVDGPVFISRNTEGRRAGRLTTNAVWRAVHNTGGRCGHGDLHPHTFRHSHLTRLAEKGHNLFAIADQAGHASLDTTRIYTHLSVTERQKMVEDL